MVSKGDPDRFFLRGHPRFRVEVLDDDVLLVDIQTGVVHRVPGPDVDLLLSGTTTLMSGHLPPGGADAIRDALSTGVVRRRTLLVGGGALAASGIIATALPFAAAALSFSYLPPAEGGTFATTAWGQTAKEDSIDSWRLQGAWSASFVDTGVAGVSGETRSVQVLLHATSGTEFGSNTAPGAGSGAYIVATVLLPANSPKIWFGLRAGGRGSDNFDLGLGGIAVGAFTWFGAGDATWFLVAGAGGGDGDGAAGGRWGASGGGTAPGIRADGGTGGAGGTGTRAILSGILPATAGQGYDALPGNFRLGRGPEATDSGMNQASQVNFYPSAGASGGGGGGAGWASGGGGGSNSGGGGGSSYLRTSDGPVVTSHVIYSFPRAYAPDGSTTRFEVYTS